MIVRIQPYYIYLTTEC